MVAFGSMKLFLAEAIRWSTVGAFFPPFALMVLFPTAPVCGYGGVFNALDSDLYLHRRWQGLVPGTFEWATSNSAMFEL
jgi:hypothetical protein